MATKTGLSVFQYFIAHKNGYFTEELAPMEVKGKKGKEPFVADEHPREASFEKLQQLKPVFKENGVVTAGNASVSDCICDPCCVQLD